MSYASPGGRWRWTFGGALVVASSLLGACAPSEAAQCTSAAECAADEECVDERCTPRQDAGQRDAGPCSDGCECIVDSECPPVVACAESACEMNACVVTPIHARCAPLGRCDVERGCVPIEDAGAAVDASVALDAGTDAGPPTPQVGDACATNADCRAISGTAECLLRNALGTVTYPGGYCTQRCASSAECPSGSACWREFFAGSCVRPCGDDAECRASEGYACRAPGRGTLDGAATACLPSGA